MEFVLGGIAASCAGIFTNPLEVLKTRMQFEGELKAKGTHPIYYRNIVNATLVIAKNEGIFALQKGLVSATCVQFIMNGSRLGFYDYFASKAKHNNALHKTVLISGIGGVIGHILANPFYLVKTHMQTQSFAKIAVGHQHRHEGTYAALKTIVQAEGMRGLYRGVTAAVPRAFAASASQLSAFIYTKKWLIQFNIFKNSPVFTSFIGGMVGGVAISVVVTPFDLVLMRLYNQGVDKHGRGVLYSGLFDCIKKVYKTEGASAFYKGLGPLYFRLGPHTTLCLVFWDGIKDIYGKLQKTPRTQYIDDRNN